MLRSDRARKLLASPLGLFVYYGLTFGVFMQLMMGPKFSWFLVALVGVPFGAVMSMATVRRINQMQAAIAQTDTERKQVRTALRTGILPDDQRLREILDGYLPALAQTLAKTSKYWLAGVVFISGYALLMMHVSSIIAIGMSVLVLAGGTTAYISQQQMAARIYELRRQLGHVIGSAPILDSSVTKILKRAATMVFRFMKVYAGLLVIFVVIAILGIRPDFARELHPLLVLGALLVLPYHILSRLLARSYGVLLVAATAWAVTGLHTPLGSKHMVLAAVPFPHDVHRISKYMAWGILHSTPLLIILCCVVLLDIFTTSAEAFRENRKEWKIFVAFTLAVIFFMLPVGSPPRTSDNRSNSAALPNVTMPVQSKNVGTPSTVSGFDDGPGTSYKLQPLPGTPIAPVDNSDDATLMNGVATRP